MNDKILGADAAEVVSARSAESEGARKHTPGPWTVDYVINGAFQISGTSEGDQCVLAQRAEFTERHEEFIANARIMAASPEMYEALKYMLLCFDRSSRDLMRTLDPVHAISFAKAAVDLAEGRT